MKERTRQAFYKWSETAKSSDKFIWEGKPYSKKEMQEHIDGKPAPVVKPAPKPEPKVEETINIDVEEKDEDLGEPLHYGDPEEH